MSPSTTLVKLASRELHTAISRTLRDVHKDIRTRYGLDIAHEQLVVGAACVSVGIDLLLTSRGVKESELQEAKRHLLDNIKHDIDGWAESE